ncbi:hypothetical protein GCM10023403_53690 [Pseudonocardia benzenivorans]|nr:hypothetical protein PSD17_01760 [Pseudonocardia sp. D17]
MGQEYGGAERSGANARASGPVRAIEAKLSGLGHAGYALETRWCVVRPERNGNPIHFTGKGHPRRWRPGVDAREVKVPAVVACWERRADDARHGNWSHAAHLTLLLIRQVPYGEAAAAALTMRPHRACQR